MEVPLPLLQAIAELSEEALHRGLTHLQAAEFLYETRLSSGARLHLKRGLTHEVAYRSLLQERRRTLHTRIVEALETLAGDRLADQIERLADHAVRGEMWDKALLYCRQGGAKAMERSASREAVGYYEQALAAVEYLPEQRRLHEVDERIFSRWRIGDEALSEDLREHLREFWQVTLHILSFVNFDLRLLKMMVEHSIDAKVGSARSAFDPPWLGTSLRAYLETNGIAGARKVNQWVQSLRFGDPY